jgi:hypothetical protein
MIMATNMDISYRQGIRSKGFAIIDPSQLRITLTINNDVVVDDDLAVSYALTATGGFTGGFPFFIPVPRRLTGQDTIQLRITNSAASQNVNVTVWYRNEL